MRLDATTRLAVGVVCFQINSGDRRTHRASAAVTLYNSRTKAVLATSSASRWFRHTSICRELWIAAFAGMTIGAEYLSFSSGLSTRRKGQVRPWLHPSRRQRGLYS